MLKLIFFWENIRTEHSQNIPKTFESLTNILNVLGIFKNIQCFQRNFSRTPARTPKSQLLVILFRLSASRIPVRTIREYTRGMLIYYTWFHFMWRTKISVRVFILQYRKTKKKAEWKKARFPERWPCYKSANC